MTGLLRRVMLGLIALGFVGVSPSWAANLLYSFSFDTTKGGGPVFPAWLPIATVHFMARPMKAAPMAVE